jgi:hypothetical protein
MTKLRDQQDAPLAASGASEHELLARVHKPESAVHRGGVVEEESGTSVCFVAGASGQARKRFRERSSERR